MSREHGGVELQSTQNIIKGNKSPPARPGVDRSHCNNLAVRVGLKFRGIRI